MKRMEGNFRLVWLEAFIAVAELRSYSRAAMRLGVAQSNVSRYVGALQEWLRKILVNAEMPVALTPDGEAFLPVARQVIGLMTESRASLPVGIDPPTKVSARDIVIK